MAPPRSAPGARREHELRELACVDGYDMHESRFLAAVTARLRALDH